jgi:hypothetical protein
MELDLELTRAERAAMRTEMRRIGSLGGKARARNLTIARRREIALRGVKARAANLVACGLQQEVKTCVMK